MEVVEALRERARSAMTERCAASLVLRCEACGLGFELLGVDGLVEPAGSCGDCGGPLYVLDGFGVDGDEVVDAYGEGFAAGWDACVALWAEQVEAQTLEVP